MGHMLLTRAPGPLNFLPELGIEWPPSLKKGPVLDLYIRINQQPLKDTDSVNVDSEPPVLGFDSRTI